MTWGDAYHAEVNRTGPSCCYKRTFYNKWIGRAGEVMPLVALLVMQKEGPEPQPPNPWEKAGMEGGACNSHSALGGGNR